VLLRVVVFVVFVVGVFGEVGGVVEFGFGFV